MHTQRFTRTARTRRGITAAYVALAMTLICGFAVLAVDMGAVYFARNQLQVSADSAALAGAWGLMNEQRLKGAAGLDEVISLARSRAAETGHENAVMLVNPSIDHNAANASSGDVVVGYLSNPKNSAQAMSFAEMGKANAVEITVHRDESRNGPIGLFFARFFGQNTKNLRAGATAAFEDGIVGFKIPDGSDETAELLPFALHVNTWNAYLAGAAGSGDSYNYNLNSKSVSSGTDGINELNIYPGSGTGQLSPGNFGTVDIGSPNNSTADLTRQILHGVNDDDLAWFGGQLKLDNQGKLYLNGDTGLSAGVKDDLEAIKGKPRIIPLFSAQAGPGNNAVYTVVGFAGVRIVHVQLTGSMKTKKVLIQPAMAVDPTAIAQPGSNSSYFVYRPPALVR